MRLISGQIKVISKIFGGLVQYLHTMVRVADLSASLRFYCDGLGLNEIRRYDSNQGRFTLVFLAAPNDIALAQETRAPLIELTITGTQRNTPVAGILAISHTGSKIFMHSVHTCRVLALPSIDHHAMVIWPLSEVLTASPLSFCNLAMHSHPASHGYRCQIQEIGNVLPYYFVLFKGLLE